MRWPYDKRVDAIHAWGAIAAGIAIAGVFYAARALNPHTAESWLWPTNWLIIPVIVTGVGLILLFLPVWRSRREAVPGGVLGAWPKPPPNHVERLELLGQLRAALLDETDGGPRRVGVRGMAGSGKSVLAAALARDDEVLDRFPDGLAWERLESPTGDPVTRPDMLAQRQQGLVDKLTPAGQRLGVVTDVEQGRDRLAELLRDQACLVVVDNVWTADDVYAFDVLGQRGALVVTTRDDGLVRPAGLVPVEVDKLDDEQAQALAAGWAGVPEQLLPPTAAETLEARHNHRNALKTPIRPEDAITVRYPIFRQRCHHLGPGFYRASAAHTQKAVNFAQRSHRLRSANAAKRPKAAHRSWLI